MRAITVKMKCNLWNNMILFALQERLRITTILILRVWIDNKFLHYGPTLCISNISTNVSAVFQILVCLVNSNEILSIVVVLLSNKILVWWWLLNIHITLFLKTCKDFINLRWIYKQLFKVQTNIRKYWYW